MKRSTWFRSEVLALALLIGLVLALIAPLVLAAGDDGGHPRSDSALPNLGHPAEGPRSGDGNVRSAVTAPPDLPGRG